MSRRKDWTELGPRTQERYQRVLERAYGKRVPSGVPDYSEWPESSRSILRAALQAYWASQDDAAKGIALAAKIKGGHQRKRTKVWPTKEEAQRWREAAEKTEPRGAFLICKVCFTRGLRVESVLRTPRSAWQSAVTYGRLKFIGKGDVEHVLDMSNLKRTLQEMLDTPGSLPHDLAAAAKFKTPPKWAVPGELLARPGSSFDTQRHMLTRYMRKVAVAAELDPALWHPHTLRHVFSDRYRGPIQELQLALGHASIVTTTRYRHPTVEDVGRHFEGD